MGRRSSIGLWVSVVSLVAACDLLSPTPKVTPGPPSSPGIGDLRTFDEGGLAFAYPAAWQELNTSLGHILPLERVSRIWQRRPSLARAAS